MGLINKTPGIETMEFVQSDKILQVKNFVLR